MTVTNEKLSYRLKRELSRQVPVAPFVVFRLWFGLMMIFSVVRFALNGWIYQLYIQPSYFFTYYGFDWVRPLSENGMYVVFLLLGLSATGILLGFRYRLSAVLFFISFTYVELLDKTNYLNHYYFISLISFLMIFLPAAGDFSLDSWRKNQKIIETPAIFLYLLRLQVGMVYFFAGIAKINVDWLLKALPLKMWLGALVHKSFIGTLFKYKITAYLFSWFGMLFDVSIPFLLSLKKTRWPAYCLLIVFHVVTWYLFPIGVFPWMMIGSALILFPVSFHEKIITVLKKWTGVIKQHSSEKVVRFSDWSVYFTALYLLIQLLLPFRNLLYPDSLFWTEEGYRFSWRVMLMEKAGYIQYDLRDPSTNRKTLISPYEYLTPQQEKMLATQPDMILQFAHHLRDEYAIKWGQTPEVYAHSYVTLNGQLSKPFIDPTVDLAMVQRGWQHKNWVLPNE